MKEKEFEMSTLISRSNSDNALDSSISVCSTTKRHPLKGKHILSGHTRYYYKTFDSSLESMEDYTYSYKRELDKESMKYNFTPNSKRLTI